MENLGPRAQQPEPEPHHQHNRMLLVARALVLADLQTRDSATPTAVSALEDSIEDRGWWAAQWPAGQVYVAGLVAQDVQDALFEAVGRWPLCSICDDSPEHALYIHPELGGPNPIWVCEQSATDVAELGQLATRRPRVAPTE